MDLKTLDTATAAELGAALHLRHPVYGHMLYDGPGADDLGRHIDKELEANPVQAIIRGTESSTFKNRIRELQKARTKSKEIAEDDEDRGLEFVCSLVIGFRNLEHNGESMDDPTEEQKRLFFEQSDNLVEQVLAFAREGRNFFKGI